MLIKLLKKSRKGLIAALTILMLISSLVGSSGYVAYATDLSSLQQIQEINQEVDNAEEEQHNIEKLVGDDSEDLVDQHPLDEDIVEGNDPDEFLDIDEEQDGLMEVQELLEAQDLQVSEFTIIGPRYAHKGETVVFSTDAPDELAVEWSTDNEDFIIESLSGQLVIPEDITGELTLLIMATSVEDPAMQSSFAIQVLEQAIPVDLKLMEQKYNQNHQMYFADYIQSTDATYQFNAHNNNIYAYGAVKTIYSDETIRMADDYIITSEDENVGVDTNINSFPNTDDFLNFNISVDNNTIRKYKLNFVHKVYGEFSKDIYITEINDNLRYNVSNQVITVNDPVDIQAYYYDFDSEINMDADAWYYELETTNNALTTTRTGTQEFKVTALEGASIGKYSLNLKVYASETDSQIQGSTPIDTKSINVRLLENINDNYLSFAIDDELSINGRMTIELDSNEGYYGIQWEITGGYVNNVFPTVDENKYDVSYQIWNYPEDNMLTLSGSSNTNPDIFYSATVEYVYSELGIEVEYDYVVAGESVPVEYYIKYYGNPRELHMFATTKAEFDELGISATPTDHISFNTAKKTMSVSTEATEQIYTIVMYREGLESLVETREIQVLLSHPLFTEFKILNNKQYVQKGETLSILMEPGVPLILQDFSANIHAETANISGEVDGNMISFAIPHNMPTGTYNSWIHNSKMQKSYNFSNAEFTFYVYDPISLTPKLENAVLSANSSYPFKYKFTEAMPIPEPLSWETSSPNIEINNGVITISEDADGLYELYPVWDTSFTKFNDLDIVVELNVSDRYFDIENGESTILVTRDYPFSIDIVDNERLPENYTVQYTWEKPTDNYSSPFSTIDSSDPVVEVVSPSYSWNNNYCNVLNMTLLDENMDVWGEKTQDFCATEYRYMDLYTMGTSNYKIGQTVNYFIQGDSYGHPEGYKVGTWTTNKPNVFTINEKTGELTIPDTIQQFESFQVIFTPKFNPGDVKRLNLYANPERLSTAIEVTSTLDKDMNNHYILNENGSSTFKVETVKDGGSKVSEGNHSVITSDSRLSAEFRFLGMNSYEFNVTPAEELPAGHYTINLTTADGLATTVIDVIKVGSAIELLSPKVSTVANSYETLDLIYKQFGSNQTIDQTDWYYVFETSDELEVEELSGTYRLFTKPNTPLGRYYYTAQLYNGDDELVASRQFSIRVVRIAGDGWLEVVGLPEKVAIDGSAAKSRRMFTIDSSAYDDPNSQVSVQSSEYSSMSITRQGTSNIYQAQFNVSSIKNYTLTVKNVRYGVDQQTYVQNIESIYLNNHTFVLEKDRSYLGENISFTSSMQTDSSYDKLFKAFKAADYEADGMNAEEITTMEFDVINSKVKVKEDTIPGDYVLVYYLDGLPEEHVSATLTVLDSPPFGDIYFDTESAYLMNGSSLELNAELGLPTVDHTVEWTASSEWIHLTESSDQSSVIIQPDPQLTSGVYSVTVASPDNQDHFATYTFYYITDDIINISPSKIYVMKGDNIPFAPQFTFNTEGIPNITDATVNVQDTTGNILLEDGNLTIDEELPMGTYSFEVQSDKLDAVIKMGQIIVVDQISLLTDSKFLTANTNITLEADFGLPTSESFDWTASNENITLTPTADDQIIEISAEEDLQAGAYTVTVSNPHLDDHTANYTFYYLTNDVISMTPEIIHVVAGESVAYSPVISTTLEGAPSLNDVTYTIEGLPTGLTLTNNELQASDDVVEGIYTIQAISERLGALALETTVHVYQPIEVITPSLYLLPNSTIELEAELGLPSANHTIEWIANDENIEIESTTDRNIVEISALPELEPGVYTVTIQSPANQAHKATYTFYYVTDEVVSIMPSPINIIAGSTIDFIAKVQVAVEGTPVIEDVSWSIVEPDSGILIQNNQLIVEDDVVAGEYHFVGNSTTYGNLGAIGTIVVYENIEIVTDPTYLFADTNIELEAILGLPGSDYSVTWSANHYELVIDSTEDSGKVTISAGEDLPAGQYTVTVQSPLFEEHVATYTFYYATDDVFEISPNKVHIIAGTSASFEPELNVNIADSLHIDDITWSIIDNIAGITLVDGLLTVDSTVEAGIYSFQGESAQYGTLGDVGTIVVYEAMEIVTEARYLTPNNQIELAVNLGLPSDQYSVDWTSSDANISISATDIAGQFIIEASSMESGQYTVTATSPELSAHTATYTFYYVTENDFEVNPTMIEGLVGDTLDFDPSFVQIQDNFPLIDDVTWTIFRGNTITSTLTMDDGQLIIDETTATGEYRYEAISQKYGSLGIVGHIFVGNLVLLEKEASLSVKAGATQLLTPAFRKTENASDLFTWSFEVGHAAASISETGELSLTRAMPAGKELIVKAVSEAESSQVIYYTITTLAADSTGGGGIIDETIPLNPNEPDTDEETTTPTENTNSMTSDNVDTTSIANQLIDMIQNQQNDLSYNGELATDIQGHWAEQALTIFMQSGILSGYSDGTVRPNIGITRAEFATLITRIFEISPTKDSVTFTDISDSWATTSIEKLALGGIVNGYQDGSFRPDATISREEMIVILSRLIQLEKLSHLGNRENNIGDLHEASVYAQEAIVMAFEAGLIQGKGNGIIDPRSNVNRAEVITILYNVMKSFK